MAQSEIEELAESSDVELIRCLAEAGEDKRRAREAARVFYERHQPQLLNYVRIRMRAMRLFRHAPEDLTQDVLLKVIRGAKTFVREDAKVTTWMYTIANNSLIDITRSKDHETTHLVGDSPSADSAKKTEEHGLGGDDRLAVREALDRLEPDLLEIVHLRFYDALSQKEVAKILKVSLKSVKDRERAARDFLRRHLEEWVTDAQKVGS